MCTKKSIFFLTLSILTFQGTGSPILGEAPSPQSSDKLPELSNLVDSSSPYGINLENVYKRQKRMRESGQLNGKDPSVSIINIQSLKDKLKTYYESTIPFQVKLKGLESDLANKKINKKKAEKSKKLIEAEQAKQLKLAFGSMEQYKTPETINPEIRRLETLVFNELKTYGLTLNQIKKLPSLKSSRSTSKEWPLN